MEWAENFIGLQHIGIPTNDMDKTVQGSDFGNI